MSSTRSERPTLGYLPPQSANWRSASSTANSSPTELPGSSALRSPFSLPNSTNTAGKMAGNSRSGAGSPSHELSNGPSRIFSKRAREIQAQEGVVTNPWGPPTSGNSTPLRENIPESPTDGSPGYSHLPTPDDSPQTRRGRAGTVPSRFPPGGASAGQNALPTIGSTSSRATPSRSPLKSPSPNNEANDASLSSNAALLSRLRAGSMPQRSQNTGPFGASFFSPNWTAGRERASTLASIASAGSNGLTSPTQSAFSKEGPGENDMQMRTLDYLGLVDTPQPYHAHLANPYLSNLAEINKSANRFRSYSVNATEKYAAAEDEDDFTASSMTPYEAQQAQLHMQLAATNAAIQQHNLAVQAFATQASSNRPRARTAGTLDTPGSRLLRNYYPTASRLDNSINASDIVDSQELEGLPQTVAAISLSNRNDGHLSAEDQALDGPTRALWLGSIPSSTTVSTLTELFKSHGPIISARVLTHKNCGFVNFERLDSAMSAKAMLNGKEIFPGAGPVRINFAKPPSPSGTPGPDGTFPSPSPDLFMKGQEDGGRSADSNGISPPVTSRPGTVPLNVPRLSDMKSEILKIVIEFGATKDDQVKIAKSLDQAIQNDQLELEIPAIPESAHNRVHDAPRLREIRKRIDNQSLSTTEIEGIAMEMLPEIAELSADYLGNTVVQKLFEHCSDEIRDAMLLEISPHMAEIGVHKNGTWAAQKIIDVCKTPKQMGMIVSNLQPYTVPLFLDQYGNYVLQCCLKFGSPFNDFIFEAMLSRMWEVAQGRYGARAMRACLESHHSTKDQQRMLAAAIALHSVRLATNANSALLLTWFLDTCTFPSRRTVLAPQLVPQIIYLCTHKVAYLTILKVINQKVESEARDAIFQALFFSADNATLQAILSDNTCGSTLIFKVITTPFFDNSIRSPVTDNIRRILLKAPPSQGYKRLMDEVGLPTRSGTSGLNRDQVTSNQSQERQSPASNHNQINGPMGQQYNHQFHPQMPRQPFDMGGMSMQRRDVDSNVSPIASFGMQTPMFPSSVPSMGMPQLQYAQLLGQSGQPMNAFYPQMQSGFGGLSATSQSADQYRNQPMQNQSSRPMNSSPMLGHNAFGPPGFSNVGMGINGYNGYGGIPMDGIHGMEYSQQQELVNGARGRQR